MTDYKVHFSFYSEEYGNFDEAIIEVKAEDIFEARHKAWLLSEDNDNLKFASDLKLCGITWESSPMNMSDYFNAEAAYIKYYQSKIENIDIPNAKIQSSERGLESCVHQKYQTFGEYSQLSCMAEAFGKPHGFMPPTIYEELHYATEFVSWLEQQGNFERAEELYNRIQAAQKWDKSSMFNIQNLFKEMSIYMNGESVDFSSQFDKHGIYPKVANSSDSDYTYIYRWQHAKKVDSISNLRVFGEKDIIPNSQSLDYSCHYIVLDSEKLAPEHRKPENIVWTVDSNINSVSPTNDEIVCARNLATNETCKWQKNDFIGVLRPDIADNINYEAISNEYQQSNHSDSNTFHQNACDDEQEI